MTGIARIVGGVVRLGVIFPLTVLGGLINSAVNTLADLCVWIEDRAR